jgi:cytochrome c oxidase subunit 2
MPSYQGQLSDEQILELIAYVRSLGKEQGKPQEKEKQAAPIGTPAAGTPPAAAGAPGETSLAAGEKLFNDNGCSTCHVAEGKGPGPSLSGVYGHTVRLSNGQTITADDEYIRESILLPGAKIVSGYQPIMPSYQGQLSDEQIHDLIDYIRSLGKLQEKKQEEGKQ